MMKWTLDNSVFSFCIGEEKLQFCDSWNNMCLGKYHVGFSRGTQASYYKENNNEILILGVCIDTSSDGTLDPCKRIIGNARCILDVLDIERDMGGKYIIFTKIEDDYYLFGDATCSLPIAFTFYRGCFYAASFEKILAEKLGVASDIELEGIQNSGSISQAMPYDITIYKEIKQLLPNNYIDINRKKVVRHALSNNVEYFSASQAANMTHERILKLVLGYSEMFKVACPITSGRDSRVVLSYFFLQDNDVPCYTINHAEFKDKEQDFVIPKLMAEKYNLNYSVLTDSEPIAPLRNYCDKVFGKGKYSLRTLMIANTIHNQFCDYAIMNGDIIGQIGKCSLHRDIPAIFATPKYFQCKLHNYSSQSSALLERWKNEIITSNEKTDLFDMFSIENRMGRWAAKEKNIYNALGQIDLNIFNSRSILQIWCSVSRKERKESKIHLELMKLTGSKFLDVPFEKEDNFLARLSKCNGISYLLGSYLKYFFGWAKYKYGGKA